MKVYKAKHLIPGYKLDLKTNTPFVAVPRARVRPDGVTVWYKDEYMLVMPGEDPVMSNTFPDRFGRGFYTLDYFQWIPSKQPTLF